MRSLLRQPKDSFSSLFLGILDASEFPELLVSMVNNSFSSLFLGILDASESYLLGLHVNLEAFSSLFLGILDASHQQFLQLRRLLTSFSSLFLGILDASGTLAGAELEYFLSFQFPLLRDSRCILFLPVVSYNITPFLSVPSS